jgi:hypothetical protein
MLILVLNRPPLLAASWRIAMELFKIRVQNLGRIKSAELTIRPLTIFCGPNNTNKTWTAYAIYGLAQRLSQWAEVWRQGNVKDVVDTISVNQGILHLIDTEVSRFIELAAKSRPDARFDHEVDRSRLLERVVSPVSIGIGAPGLSQLTGASAADVEDGSLTLDIEKDRFGLPMSERVSLLFQKGELSLFSAQFDNFNANFDLGRFDYERLAAGYVRPAIELLAFGILRRALAFPAERNLLNLLYNRNEVDVKKAESLALPLKTYTTFMIEDLHRKESPKGRESVLAAIEQVLGGRIELESDGAWRELVFRFGPDRKLRLPAVSSLVRSMAGIYRYLATVAQDGDLVIIDEPEMNAHPEAQLMIAELLGVLVHHGINVVITTHSPYIVDHINNLMEAAELPAAQQEAVARRFRLGMREAFVPTSEVAAYVFDEDGGVTDAIDRSSRIIDWSTFGRTSDHVANLYSDILEAAEKE